MKILIYLLVFLSLDSFGMYWGKGGKKQPRARQQPTAQVAPQERTLNEQFLQFIQTIDNPPLFAGEGNLIYLEYLIDQGASPNIRIKGKIPLLLHVIYWLAKGSFNHEKQKNILEKLIKKGVNIDAADSKGVTALMYAAMYDLPFVAQILLENGANFNAVNDAGKTAIILAEELHSNAVLKVLRSFTVKHKIP